MHTQLAPDRQGDQAALRATEIIGKCVHCGFCNATCPTYRYSGNELEGPRGRIYMAKGLLERNQSSPTLEASLSRCLTCRACETTCPSGVEFGELAEFARFELKQKQSNSWLERALLSVVPNYHLFRRLYKLLRPLRAFLPRPVRELMGRKLPPHTKPRERVADLLLLQGCVQQALTPEVVEHLGYLLDGLGIKYQTLGNEHCCGALHLHLGHRAQAQTMMRGNIDQIAQTQATSVVSSASGCGVTLREYDRIIGDDTLAKVFSSKIEDVAEILRPHQFKRRFDVRRIAFQSPCTLQHGMRITGLVEEKLEQAGYELCHVEDGHQCCGAAGTYSILQSRSSKWFRARKVEALLADHPEVIATANVGCQLHLESAVSIPVKHWIELLETKRDSTTHSSELADSEESSTTSDSGL